MFVSAADARRILIERSETRCRSIPALADPIKAAHATRLDVAEFLGRRPRTSHVDPYLDLLPTSSERGYLCRREPLRAVPNGGPIDRHTGCRCVSYLVRNHVDVNDPEALAEALAIARQPAI